MGPVVGGVDAPGVPRAVMVGMADAVHDGVTQLPVGVRHVDAGAQHLHSVAVLASTHTIEQVEVDFDAAIAKRAVGARLPDGPARGHDGIGILVVDIGDTLADELLCPLVELLETVGRVLDPAVPLEAQPADVLLDGRDEVDMFRHRVGVVHAQVADSVEVFGHAEVETDGLGVADVQVAVGLRREPGDHPATVDPRRLVASHLLADEVGCGGGLGCGGGRGCGGHSVLVRVGADGRIRLPGTPDSLHTGAGVRCRVRAPPWCCDGTRPSWTRRRGRARGRRRPR